MKPPPYLLILCLALLTGCAVTRTEMPGGGSYLNASLMENAAEKTRLYDPATGYLSERVVAQNQTDGPKVIATGIVSLRTIEATSDFLLKRLGKEQAIETATIQAGSNLDLAKEANRSAEALKALDIEAAVVP